MSRILSFPSPSRVYSFKGEGDEPGKLKTGLQPVITSMAMPTKVMVENIFFILFALSDVFGKLFSRHSLGAAWQLGFSFHQFHEIVEKFSLIRSCGIGRVCQIIAT